MSQDLSQQPTDEDGDAKTKKQEAAKHAETEKHEAAKRAEMKKLQEEGHAIPGAVRFQLLNLTPLPDGLLPVVKRSASYLERRMASPIDTSTAVLAYGRTLQGKSVHVQMRVPTSFLMQLPWSWTINEVKRLAQYFKADTRSCTISKLIRYVYYTPHLPTATEEELKVPQRLPFAKFVFKSTKACVAAFNKLKGYHGQRTRDHDLKSLFKAAGFPAAFAERTVNDVVHDKLVFAVCDMTDPVRDFFSSVTRHLAGLAGVAKRESITFETWLELRPGVKWLGPHVYFANSDMNATITLDDIVSGVDSLDSSPMTILSFDVEQYSPVNTDPTSDVPVGRRGFPEMGCAVSDIRNICCTVATSETSKLVNIALCVGKAVIGKPVVETEASEQSEERQEQHGNKEKKEEEEEEEAKEEPTDVRCYENELQLLLAFGKLLEDVNPDVVTGYNMAKYDLMVVYARVYFYYFCKKHDFNYVHGIWRRAADAMKAYSELRCSTEGTWMERQEKMTRLFNLSLDKSKGPVKPPLPYVLLSKVRAFTVESHRRFRDACNGVSADVVGRFFFCGRVATWTVGFEDSMHDTSASGQLESHLWTKSGYALMCMFMHLKKNGSRLESYKLADVMMHYFSKDASKHKIDLGYEEMFRAMESDNPLLKGKVARYCVRDAEAVMHLMRNQKVEVDTRQRAAVVNFAFEALCSSGQQRPIQRVYHVMGEGEYAFNDFKPEPFKYEGAIVLEPKRGFYADPVVVSDFASLYPSIMQAFNCCPSNLVKEGTAPPPPAVKTHTSIIERDAATGKPTVTATFVQGAGFGLTPRLLSKFLGARAAVRNNMKTVEDKRQLSLLNSKQLQLKVSCNSVYGYFGVKEGICPLARISATVTAEGRKIIESTRDAVIEKFGLDVIYGDTDSLMMHAEGRTMEQAWELNKQVTRYVTDDFLGHLKYLKFEAEKICRPYLLMNKKKYCSMISMDSANPYKVKLDYKGILLKRRDSCRLVRDMMQQALEIMMPGERGADLTIAATAPALKAMTAAWLKKVENDELDLEYYVTSKTAKRDYNTVSLPEHMLVYWRHNARVARGQQPGEMFAPGDRVRFVVVIENTVDKSCLPAEQLLKEAEAERAKDAKARALNKKRPKVASGNSMSSSHKVGHHVEEPEWVAMVESMVKAAKKQQLEDQQRKDQERREKQPVCTDLATRPPLPPMSLASLFMKPVKKKQAPASHEALLGSSQVSSDSNPSSSSSSSFLSSSSLSSLTNEPPPAAVQVPSLLRIDRVYYLKKASKALSELMQFHIPDVDEMYQKTIEAVYRQQTGGAKTAPRPKKRKQTTLPTKPAAKKKANASKATKPVAAEQKAANGKLPASLLPKPVQATARTAVDLQKLFAAPAKRLDAPPNATFCSQVTSNHVASNHVASNHVASNQSRAGLVRVGRRVYASGGKWTDPKAIPGFTVVLCLTPSTEYGAISPYSLRDKLGRNMENLWQFSKVYKTVPASKQTYSRYNDKVIWDHPAETHVDADGTLLPAYWAWRAKGFATQDAVRYPVGFHHRTQCIGALQLTHLEQQQQQQQQQPDVSGPIVTDASAENNATVERPPVLLNYIESRRMIYLPLYASMLQGQPLFEKLRLLHNQGTNLLIVEVDGPHQESMPYYKQRYNVPDDFIDDDNTIDVNEQSMKIMLNDPKHPFGHGYCLALAVMGKHEEYNQSL
jgi:DNA polymerase elongation subunit (family B)